jgi:predicted dehydrogenase
MSTPLRLGLVGLNFGRHICQELVKAPELPVRLAKVCDLDAEKAQTLATQFGVGVSPSLDALLADPEIDVIGLYTGPNGRANLIRRIIRAGKDVMTTKPFEVDPLAAREVLREAKALGRVVHLNSPNPRPYGEAVHIAEWLAAGRIGRPTLAQASVWVYYGPTAADGSWYDDPKQCPVAPIFRLGIYPLNVLLTIFRDPVRVSVTKSRVETQRPTCDNASVTIEFADGAIVNMVASFVVGGPDRYKNSLTICGTQGVIYYRTGPAPRDETPEPNLILSTDDALESRTVTTHAGGYDWEFFAQRVRGEATDDVTTPEQVAAAISVIQAMAKSEETGDTVAVEALPV